MRPAALLALLLVTGCGSTTTSETPDIDSIAGSQVGAMAERQLETTHPGMAPGELTCPDLDFEVGSEVRCERVAELSGGRLIRVSGTVSVTSTEGGGRLHVKLDDEVAEFGITGDALEDDLRKRAAAKLKAEPDEVTCPYLTGEVGTKARCRVRLDDKVVVVVAVITGREPEENLTRYRFEWRADKARIQRSLAFVATGPSGVVDWHRDHRSRAAA
ncbi:hypothetical protein EFK50_19870 [Nocardioides marmoriginsengisoli]|uniref:DUF4333 domain-containing protein n=1 Tax=Nocardioides marmoriginsengisoli TaxID=661483 RepID=A0A3N0CBY4_9ACTN|nr:hypothetical protein [Nocardioides marmoriginsengisoli]RNL60576.1 hypothetical protein EFK50_19870 [Nocardioides marmoriginsengisoli]